MSQVLNIVYGPHGAVVAVVAGGMLPAVPPPQATWGLRYEFEAAAPGFLGNSGTLGAAYDLTTGDICLG